MDKWSKIKWFQIKSIWVFRTSLCHNVSFASAWLNRLSWNILLIFPASDIRCQDDAGIHYLFRRFFNGVNLKNVILLSWNWFNNVNVTYKNQLTVSGEYGNETCQDNNENNDRIHCRCFWSSSYEKITIVYTVAITYQFKNIIS